MLYQVTRFCCTSGMCLDCRAVGNRAKRKRVVQADRLTRATAEDIARNWKSYDAKAEPMPEETHGRD